MNLIGDVSCGVIPQAVYEHMDFRKDKALDELAELGNVAQFVSFAPVTSGDPEQTFSRVWKHPANHRFESVDEAIRTLHSSSPDGSINLRSFTPDNPRSREFLYGLTNVKEAVHHLHRLARSGLFVIANETVDVSDGGVSGVIEGGVIEFAPDDTPRCVEKPGTASFCLEDGLRILGIVYGVNLQLPDCMGKRVEFSVHPRARGYHRTHSLLWELEPVATTDQSASLAWPNKFSRLVGDKAFGLLVAHTLGHLVPQSLVLSRRVPPFSFGQETGSKELWLRTCPTEQVPGKYTTANKWIDPFQLVATEDPTHDALASVISQAAVPARYSGAAITKRDGRLHVEGTAGTGEDLMLGKSQPGTIPDDVIADLKTTYEKLRSRLGPVRFEWVHDGEKTWIVQLHKGATRSTSTTIVPGDATDWATFRPEAGLEALRELIARLPAHVGLKLEGEVGLTSHIADLARKSRRPTRIVRTGMSRTSQLLLEWE